MEDNSPKIYSAQPAGCNPVVTAIHKGMDIIEPQKPNTIAKSLAIGNPADGYYAYNVVKDSKGWGESATDREIIDAIKLLGKTGRHLDRTGRWHHAGIGDQADSSPAESPSDESIVISITGNGLKTQEAVADELPYPAVIDPKLSEFDRLLQKNLVDAAVAVPALASV